VRRLSGTLVTLLGTAMKTGATHVDIIQTGTPQEGATWLVRWLRGEELVATGNLPTEEFAPLGEELIGLGARKDASTRIGIISPRGPMGVDVALSPRAIQLGLRDEETAADEEKFSELMAYLDSIDADRVTCANDEARFDRGEKGLQIVPLVAGVVEVLVRHAKRLAPVGDDEREGNAVLFGKDGARSLHIVLLEGGGVRFVVGDPRDPRDPREPREPRDPAQPGERGSSQ
jgi:hypothetical protein